MPRHIFIDNSNIFGGAQRAAETLEPGAVWLAVRLYFKNLAKLLEKGDAVTTRMLAGSMPPGNDALWEHARQAGYNTDLLHRVEVAGGKLVEQGVDEMLHLKIANAILDCPAPQTLVIASGDGRVSTFNTGFTTQAERALKFGWNVEVWSWSGQLSNTFARMAARHGGRLTVHLLDPYYRSLTFVSAGNYTVGTTSMTVAARVVSKLPA